jgi:hypothetical protein
MSDMHPGAPTYPTSPTRRRRGHRRLARDRGVYLPRACSKRPAPEARTPDRLVAGSAYRSCATRAAQRHSYPWRDRDEGPRQPDGWEVSVQNTGTQTLRAIVYVTCG